MSPKETDIIELIIDIPEYFLKTGDQGTIVMVYNNPEEAYEVEFLDEDGSTKEIIVLRTEQFKVIWRA